MIKNLINLVVLFIFRIFVLLIIINNMEKIDYTGEKFGLLTILRDGQGLYEGKKKRRSVICKCECGVEKEVILRVITKGNIKSCGCLLASQKIDIKEGDKYGYWTIVKEVDPYKDRKGNSLRTVLSKCICGKHSEVILNSLRQGKSKSCGCMVKYSTGERVSVDSPITPLNIEEVNKQDFGYWKIIEEISAKRDKNRNIKRLVKAQCKCGYIKESNLSNMHDSKQCIECFNKERVNKLSLQERKIKTRLQGILGGMIQRCHNTNNKSYNTYGGRGITVTDEWKNNSKSFIEWSLNNGYQYGLEIDRINNNEGYCPDNCQFISKEENNLRQKNINLTIEDVRWIRSEDYTLEKALEKFTCSERVILNIREYRTFKDI